MDASFRIEDKSDLSGQYRLPNQDNHGNEDTSTASCAADELATGGGILDSGGGNVLNTIDSGVPAAAPNQWSVTLSNLGPSFVFVLFRLVPKHQR